MEDESLQLGVLDELKDVMGDRIGSRLAPEAAHSGQGEGSGGGTVTDGAVDGNGIAESGQSATADPTSAVPEAGLPGEEGAEGDLSEEDKALLVQNYGNIGA